MKHSVSRFVVANSISTNTSSPDHRIHPWPSRPVPGRQGLRSSRTSLAVEVRIGRSSTQSSTPPRSPRPHHGAQSYGRYLVQAILIIRDYELPTLQIHHCTPLPSLPCVSDPKHCHSDVCVPKPCQSAAAGTMLHATANEHDGLWGSPEPCHL